MINPISRPPVVLNVPAVRRKYSDVEDGGSIEMSSSPKIYVSPESTRISRSPFSVEGRTSVYWWKLQVPGTLVPGVASGAAATTSHRACQPGISVPRRSAAFGRLPAYAPRTEANPPSHPVLERLVIIRPSVPPVLSLFRLARCPYNYFD